MFLSSLLFGISASLDALLVGISYGIRRVRIRLWQNLAISLVTLLGTCLSVGLGHRLAAVLPKLISEYAGSLVLILLGLYYMIKWLRQRLRTRHPIMPESTSPDSGTDSGPAGNAASAPASCSDSAYCPGTMSASEHACECNTSSNRNTPFCLKPAEVASLSLTLSVNNLSAGFSASLAGLSLLPAAASTFLCSVLFLFSGNRLGGSHWLQIAGCAAEPVSGMLLIGLGIIQFFL